MTTMTRACITGINLFEFCFRKIVNYLFNVRKICLTDPDARLIQFLYCSAAQPFADNRINVHCADIKCWPASPVFMFRVRIIDRFISICLRIIDNKIWCTSKVIAYFRETFSVIYCGNTYSHIGILLHLFLPCPRRPDLA